MTAPLRPDAEVTTQATLDLLVARARSAENEHAVRAVLDDPELLLVGDSEHMARIYNPLCTACTPVQDLAELGAGVDLEGSAHVTVTSTDRMAPWMVLVYALGARVSDLPGYLGNAVIAASAVAETRRRVQETFDADRERILERAQRFLTRPNNDPSHATEVLRALPEALDVALREERGVVTFGFSP
ncbi:MAG: hypothetical protein ACAI25_10840 [Planctomycetota bacterium]